MYEGGPKNLVVGITGGHGQIGTELARQHRRRGDKVVQLTADVRNYEDLCAGVDHVLASHSSPQFDIVYNCAALVGTIACDIAGTQAWEVNVRGAENVARMARLWSRSFVHLSTTAIYDPQAAREGLYHENSPVRPYTHYGLTKAESEVAVVRLWAEDDTTAGRPLTVVRPCFCYGGDGDRVSTVRGYIDAAFARRPYIVQLDGRNEKDWMHIEDFGAMLVAWALRRLEPSFDHPRVSAELLRRANCEASDVDVDVVNIAAGHPTCFGAVRSTIDLMLAAEGVSPPYVVDLPDDDYLGVHLVDVSRLRAVFPGLLPKTQVFDWSKSYIEYRRNLEDSQ